MNAHKTVTAIFGITNNSGAGRLNFYPVVEAAARIRLYVAAMPAGQVALLDRTECVGVPRFLTPYFYTNAPQLPVTIVIPAVAYRLLASTNLSGWVSIATNTPITSGTLFVDPRASNFLQRYYRTVTP